MKGSKIFILLFLGFYCNQLFAQTDTTDFNTKVEIDYIVKKVGRINSVASDFSPVIIDNYILFASDREVDYIKWGEDHGKKKKHLMVFKAKYLSPNDDTVQFAKAELWQESDPSFYHTGPITMHPSGNYAVLTKVAAERKFRTNKPQLYLITKSNNSWSKPVLIKFCNNNSSYGHACFSDDGNTLYFASDQIGTKGQKDIFKCSFNNGNFGSPENCGDLINTTGNEMFPFFSSGILYFASDKPGGVGGLDIYQSEYSNNIFDTVKSLGNKINSTEDDFSFYLTKSGRNGFYASARKDLSNGSDDIFFFVVKKSATVVSKNISGKFTYSRLTNEIPSGLELQLLDEAGNIVQVTRTDEKGHFKFSNLAVDENYTIKLVELSPDLVLHVFNKDGEEIAVLMSNTKGTFVYKKLKLDEVGTLSFMQYDDTGLDGKKSGKINGQFVHERLLDANLNGLNVMLVDEAGNVFAKTKTDKNGNFSFYKLTGDQNFYITTDSDFDDLKLLLYNNKEQIIAELKRKQGSPFMFRRLDGELENKLSLLENTDTNLFPPNYTNLSGNFKHVKLNGEVNDLDFLVLDEAGNVLAKGKTNKNGDFILTGLPNKEIYIFKFTDDDAGLETNQFKLQMLNRFDQELQMIESTEAGLFVFDRKQKTKDVPGAVTIYFDKNIDQLTEENRRVLIGLLQILKENPKLHLQLDAHTDASATDEFNISLSMRRMLNTKQFFIKNGIPSNRINGFYHGEKQLINNCTDATQCTDEQNRQNRRCTVAVINDK